MKPVVIDVRDPDEYQEGHHSLAINIPLSTVQSSAQLSHIDKHSPLILYCRSGARSQQAISILSSRGFTNLTNGVNQHRVEEILASQP